MTTLLIRCHGCDRTFNHRGLSQHISKTQDIRCRGNFSMSQEPAVSTSTSHPAPSPPFYPLIDPPLDQPGTSQVSLIDDPGAESSNEHGSNAFVTYPELPTAPLDSTDVADADIFEDLSRDNGPFPTTILNHPAVDDAPEVSEDPIEEIPQIEVQYPETALTVVIDRFPSGNPGAPIPGLPHGPSAYESYQATASASIWAPFYSQCDWKFAHWAKTCGPTSSAVTELLAMPEIVDMLNLSYRTVKQLNNIIDDLPGSSCFQCRNLSVGNEPLEFYCRDVLECIRSLYGDPQFAQDLAFAPERHFTSQERTCRLYNEMFTGDWWWAVQESLESCQPGATVIPVIISSDKTQLTLFRDKMAYPIYLTIGNIPKDIRRKPSRHAQVLLGYIPVTKLEHLKDKTTRRRGLTNLFHACMAHVLRPIMSCGETGVAMASGDGVWRRCHPIFATFVGDYPEQTLVTCTYSGRCPKCTIPPNQLGAYETFPPRLQSEMIDVYLLADTDIHEFHTACQKADMKPIEHPFWERLPLADIFLSITPDILHQMLQGMVKHLIEWLTEIFGPAEIDARCRSIPPNHNISLFTNGISNLSRVSGHEHKKICSILLGLVVNLPVPGGHNSSRVVKAVRSLLDFLYIAQYQCHTSDTLDQLQSCLAAFHEHKTVFLDLGARENFNLPKLHSLSHYVSSIRLFGTTDNYNTEQSERLHIDFAKNAYRASNHKDEYPQMTLWLERREKVQQYARFIEWRQQDHQQTPGVQIRKPIGPPCIRTLRIKMTRHPSIRNVGFDILAQKYGAVSFLDALADFLVQVNNPGMSGNALRAQASNLLIPFSSVPVFHKIKFTTGTSGLNESEVLDSIQARPEQRDARKRIIPARFDTALVRTQNTNQSESIKCHRIAQVRVVFHIPSSIVHAMCPSLDTLSPTHLAYVEWFSPLTAAPDPKHRMYKVSRQMRNGRRFASIIPVDRILRSIHLIPQFGPVTPREWNSFTVLDQCHTFYVNSFSDVHSYLALE